MLKNKTVVLVTHAVQYLPEVDQVLVLESGMIKEAGTYAELSKQSGGILAALVSAHEADGLVLSESMSPKGEGKGKGMGKDAQASAAGKDDEKKDAGKELVGGGKGKGGGGGGDLTGLEKSAKGQVKRQVYQLYLQVRGPRVEEGLELQKPAHLQRELFFNQRDDTTLSNLPTCHLFDCVPEAISLVADGVLLQPNR